MSVQLWDPKANGGKGGLVTFGAEEATGALSSDYQLPIGMPQYLVRPDGSVAKGVVTKDNAAQLARDLANGARFATEDEKAYKERSDKYSDQNLKAGLVSAANELTLGGLGVVAKDAMPEFAEDIKGLAEFNRGATIAGGVAGALLPVLATGGSGALARGAVGAAELGVEAAGATSRLAGASKMLAKGLANTPSGLLSRGGMAIEKAALGKGMSRATAAALGQTVENALYGGIRSATEDSLYDKDLTIESVAANTALGGLFGAVGGYAGQKIPEALGAAKTKMRDGIKRLWKEKTGNELGDGVAGYFQKTTGLDDAIPAAPAAGYVDEIPIAKRAQGLDKASAQTQKNIFMSADEVDAFKPRMQRNVDQINDLGNRVENMMRGAAKRKTVENLIPSGPLPAEAAEEIVAEADNLLGRLSDIREDPQQFGMTAKMGAAQMELFEKAHEAVTKAAQSTEADAALNLFMAADEMKRISQRFRKKASRSMSSVAQDTFDQAESGLRMTLENKANFGAAAELQKDFNDAWSRHIANEKVFSPKFTTRTGEFEPYEDVYRADPKAIGPFMDSLGVYTNSLEEQVFRRHIDTQAELAEVLAKYVDIDAGDLQTIRETSSSIKGDMEKMIGIMRDRNQYEALASRGSKAVVGGLGGAGIGYLATGGDTEGAAVGGLVGAAINPAKRIKALAAFNSMAEFIATKMAKATKGYVSSVSKKAGGGASAKDLGRAAYKVLTFQEYNKAIDAIRRYSLDPKTVEEQTRQSIGADNADAAPGTSGAVLATNMKGINYLASKIPPSGNRLASILPPRAKTTVPAADRIRFTRVLRAVQDPLTVIDDLKDGRITKDAVDAVKVVYPRIYSKMVETVVTELQNNPEALPYREKVKLSVMLGMPLHPSMAPAFMNAMDAALGKQIQDPNNSKLVTPSNSKVFDKASLLQTDTQKILEGGY